MTKLVEKWKEMGFSFIQIIKKRRKEFIEFGNKISEVSPVMRGESKITQHEAIQTELDELNSDWLEPPSNFLTKKERKTMEFRIGGKLI